MSYPSKQYPEQEAIDAAVKMLAEPCGVIFFPVCLRKLDGSPNIFVLENSERKFSFDGAARTVSFTNRARTLTDTLREGSYDIAMLVGCVWDDQKDHAEVFVRGQENTVLYDSRSRSQTEQLLRTNPEHETKKPNIETEEKSRTGNRAKT
jgi:hypothetical protein